MATRSDFVLVFDADEAGARATKKWMEHYSGCKAIAFERGDCNDFLRAHESAEAAAEAFTAKLPELEWRGRLQLSENAHHYAQIFLDFQEKPPGLFDFAGCQYYATTKQSREGPELNVRKVANFTARVDHFLEDSTNPEKPILRPIIEVRKQRAKPRLTTWTAADLVTPAGVRKTALEQFGAMWAGKERETELFTWKISESKAPIVKQCYILGHDLQSDCMVFQDFAVDQTGKMVLPDNRGFFKIGYKGFLTPPKIPTLRPERGIDPGEIYDLIAAAWPDNGPLAVSYGVSSWFVNIIKPQLGFFPFLSVWGETQTGKTRLMRVLNALQCLDEEGLPMTKLNTGKGEIRKLAQRSGLFKCLLEANQANTIRFPIESLLTLFNYGNHLQVRATKTNDIQTHETEFLSSLIFAQNSEPFRTKAQMERVISSRQLKTEDLTPETTAAYNRLMKIPLRQLACFYVGVMAHRRTIEAEWLAFHEAARQEIFDAILDNRIAETHAIVLAFHRLLLKILPGRPEQHDLTGFIIDLARRKQYQCSHRQASIADSFFESLFELNDQAREKFSESKEGRLLVKLPLALKTLDGHGYRFVQTQVMEDLREHPAFLASRVSYRGYFGSQVSGSVKVWAFDESKIK